MLVSQTRPFVWSAADRPAAELKFDAAVAPELQLVPCVSAAAAVVLLPPQQQGQVGVTPELDQLLVVVELVGLPGLPLDWLVVRRVAFVRPVVFAAELQLVAARVVELVAEHIADVVVPAYIDAVAATFDVGLGLVQDAVRRVDSWLVHAAFVGVVLVLVLVVRIVAATSLSVDWQADMESLVVELQLYLGLGFRLEPEPVHDPVRRANRWLEHRSVQDSQRSLKGRNRYFHVLERIGPNQSSLVRPCY